MRKEYSCCNKFSLLSNLRNITINTKYSFKWEEHWPIWHAITKHNNDYFPIISLFWNFINSTVILQVASVTRALFTWSKTFGKRPGISFKNLAQCSKWLLGINLLLWLRFNVIWVLSMPYRRGVHKLFSALIRQEFFLMKSISRMGWVLRIKFIHKVIW